MNNVYNEPKYDTDMANKGYVDKTIDKKVGVALGYVEEDISELDDKVSTKTQNFGSQPTPPYYVNDTWMNGNDIYICKTERLIGNFVSSDWEKASTYDNTKSVLDGGITTNGTLVVARGGTVSAGLTAYTSGDNGVRMWAGSDIAGINSAPFRVLQNGSVFMTKANITGGDIKVHGSRGQSLIKAYVDGYENSAFAEMAPNYVRVENIDSSTGNGYYYNVGLLGGLEASHKISDTEFESSQVFPYMIWCLHQNGSSSTSSALYPDRIETPKIVAGNIDCGTCTLSTINDTVVPFNKTFSSPPIVILTCTMNNTGTRVYSGSVIATTTTGFTAFSMVNTGSSNNVTFNWIAIGT